MTCRRIAAAGGVAKKSECPNGRVGLTGGVAQKRSGAYGGIFACCIGKQRPGADTCAEITVGEAYEREYAKC